MGGRGRPSLLPLNVREAAKSSNKSNNMSVVRCIPIKQYTDNIILNFPAPEIISLLNLSQYFKNLHWLKKPVSPPFVLVAAVVYTQYGGTVQCGVHYSSSCALWDLFCPRVLAAEPPLP